jgi:hypothetical protein
MEKSPVTQLKINDHIVGNGRRVLAIFLAVTVTLLLVPIEHAQAQAAPDLLTAASSAISPLKALDVVVTAGIGEAISKLDDSLRARLEQLHAIIQEALATIDQILKTRIDQLDQVTRNRLDQALRGATQLASKFSADYQQGIHVADEALRQRIEQFQNQVGNVVGALPINFDPLLNVDTTKGLTTVRQRGDYTSIMVSGVALFKDNTKPEAFLLLKPEPTNIEWGEYHLGVSQNAIRPVQVASYSMGLIELRIKNSDIPQGVPPPPLTLLLRVRRGSRDLGLVKDYSEPTFPLRVCDALPHYKANVSVMATGEKWERREIPVPGAQPTKGHQNGFYIECCGSNDCNSHLPICAVPSEGFEVDNDPLPGYEGGLRWGPHDGDHYHDFNAGVPHSGCVQIYCDGRNGSSNSWVAEVYERQRRKVNAEPCTEHGAMASLDLAYNAWRQIEVNLKDAIGPCGEAGLSKSPVLTYRLKVEDDAHSVVWMKDLIPDATAQSENGDFQASISSSGLLNTTAKAQCNWSYDVAVKR